MKSFHEVFECNTLEEVVLLVNYHENPAWVAGTWAHQAAYEAGYGVTPENLRGQLEFLSTAGAAFDEGAAVKAALAIQSSAE